MKATVREILYKYGHSNFSLSGNGSYTLDQAISALREVVVPESRLYKKEKVVTNEDVIEISEAVGFNACRSIVEGKFK